MRDAGLAENTIRKATGRARQFFKDAIKRKLVQENPFTGLAAHVKPERARDYFVTEEQAQAVLDACPNAQWRCLFALARYGGLRTPSESLGLLWADIDLANNRITVRSPKTERHDGQDVRLVPLFPELLSHLQDAFDQADDGAEYVVTSTRDAGVNLRTHLQRIIHRAGLTPWPKLWQNLRATRATELAQRFPAHVAAAWLGHSVKIAEAHYLQVTAQHFAAAAQPTPLSTKAATQRVSQNPTQQPHATPRIDATLRQKTRIETHKLASQNGLVPEVGLEPTSL